MVTGARSGHDIDLRAMAVEGMVLLGALTGFEHGRFGVAADLAESFATADDSRRNFIKTVDDHVTERGLDLPRQPEDEITPGAGHPLPAELSRLDPTAAGIRSIVWCTGYRPDFSWVELPVIGKDGRPQHDQGVTKLAGVYFTGLAGLSSAKSSFMFGAGVDAARLAGHLVARPQSAG